MGIANTGCQDNAGCNARICFRLNFECNYVAAPLMINQWVLGKLHFETTNMH